VAQLNLSGGFIASAVSELRRQFLKTAGLTALAGTTHNSASYIDHWVRFFSSHESAIVTPARRLECAQSFL